VSKIMIIGIDSMDSVLLSKFEKDLPNLRRIKENSPDVRMISVFPPDSDTAWASVYTGLNPAKHGVVHFLDPLEKSVTLQTQETDHSTVQGKTFWDFAGMHKKVCILLPHIGYPPWQVNGVMVARSSIGKGVKVFPESVADNYDLSTLEGVGGVPSKREKSLKKFIEDHKRLISNEIKFSLEMLKADDWGVFFTYSSSLDAIQHYFWNYCDEADSAYQRGNPFKNVIKDFYALYDVMVGKLISSVDDETAIIILSDHGHGGRPPKLININELLRISGFINVKNKNPTNNILEKLKSKSVEWISRYDLGWIASKILKVFPKFKEFYSVSHSLDLNSSLAYVTDLSGIKAYTYGGIKINKDKLAPDDYEIVREKIIQILKRELAEKIIRIAKREEVYYGEYLPKYPDILLQLKEGYGLGNKINAPVIDNAYTSNIVPGSHRGETPVFFILNSNKEVIRKNMSLMDVAPTILDLLDIDWRRFDFDGESILEGSK